MASAPQYTLDLPLLPRYAIEDFIVAPSNEAAFHLATHPETWPQPIAVLIGEPGIGKTHLAHILSQHCDARFITADMLGSMPADALSEGAATLILDGLESVAVRGGKTEAALAQLINHIRATGTPSLLLTARHAPARMEWGLPDLASRLRAAWQVTMAAPDDALMAALLRKAFADRQLRVGEEVIAYLLPRIERSTRAVQHTALVLDRAALAGARPITLPLVRDVLAREENDA